MLLDTADLHGLSAFVCRRLETVCADLLPDAVRSTLEELDYSNRMRNLFLCGSLLRILRLFEKNGIPAMPFKGPVQAEYLYKDSGLRTFSDLDILVSRQDAVKARDLLVANDFVTDPHIPEKQLETYLESENFFELKNRSGAVAVDLHWELTGRYSTYPLRIEDFSGRLETLNLAGTEVRTLCLEDMLIYLCIHGTSHCWEPLELVCSVAEIVKSDGVEHWDALLERASKFRCRRMVLLGLALAEDLFDARLPDRIKSKIDMDGGVRKLEGRTLKKILHGRRGLAESLSWRFSSLHPAVRDNLPDSIRYGFRLLFFPTIREWIRYPLPAPLLFLYYVIRPYRLLKDGLRSSTTRVS